VTAPRGAAEPTLEDLDRQSVFHPFTSIQDHLVEGPLVITEAKGVRVRGHDGREYIDAMAGLWCVNVGYGRRELVEAMTAQAERLPYFHSFAGMSHEPMIRLAARLLELVPGRMSKVFFCNSGSEANDTQIKLIRYYNNLRGKRDKKKILSRKAAYHGVTLGAASLSGLPPMHAIFDLPLPGFFHLERPSHYWHAAPGMSEEEFSGRLAAELEALIAREGADTIAAMFVEPVMGAGGVIVPPRGYFEKIVPILRAHDILLVADEVICGFGRLGTPFGSDYYSLEPDLMTIAKGLTSGYLPMSACLISERIWEEIRERSRDQGPFAHGYTYSGHPLASAVAIANLDLMERDRLFERSAATGAYLQRRLRELASHPLVGEVRGVGMIAGIELVASKSEKKPFPPAVLAGAKVAKHALRNGVITRALRDTLAFSPPLVLEQSDVDRIVEVVGGALDATAKDLAAAGAWRPEAAA
jgi:L-2,4-diaminobutyrate transaminase